MSIDELADKLGPLFEKHKEVGIVYLFGSQATKNTHPNSDFDFAIYFDEKNIVKRSNLLFGLAGDISLALKTDKIDVHILNDIESPSLKYNILYYGKVIFEREPFRLLIEPRILNEYFDFLYLLRKYKLTAQ